MDFLCTTCCKEKRTDPGLLPAVERYLSRRIAFVQAESRRLGLPLLIFSGKYGLLAPEDPIPWYDQRLTMEAVPALAPVLAAQLAERGARRITFYCRPATDAGWAPYYAALEEACRRQGLELERRIVDLD